MKRTPEDTTFAAHFGREIRTKYEEAKQGGKTDAEFAASIGVARAQLDKYLRGEAVPAIRTIALARRIYGIAVPYGDTDVSHPRKARRRQKAVPDQLELPFTIWAEGAGQFDLKLQPVSTRRFALSLIVRKSSA